MKRATTIKLGSTNEKLNVLLVKRAACFFGGRRYTSLRYLCEKQKTISTRKLEQILLQYRKEMCADGQFLMRLAEGVMELEKEK